MRLTTLSGPGGADYPTESLASAPLNVWTRKQQAVSAFSTLSPMVPSGPRASSLLGILSCPKCPYTVNSDSDLLEISSLGRAKGKKPSARDIVQDCPST